MIKYINDAAHFLWIAFETYILLFNNLQILNTHID